MPSPFKVHELLSRSELDELESFAREPGRTVDECCDWLLERQFNVSHGAVGNWLREFKSLLLKERFSGSAQLAASIQSAMKDGSFDAVDGRVEGGFIGAGIWAAGGSAAFVAAKVHGGGADAGVKIGDFIAGQGTGFPEFEESILHSVLGIGLGGGPLAGEKEQGWAVVGQPDSPSVWVVFQADDPCYGYRRCGGGDLSNYEFLVGVGIMGRCQKEKPWDNLEM